MLLAFRCRNLLELIYWSVHCSVPILSGPFILSVFGFRGSARTALFGMATGALSILTWEIWIKYETGINGSFICMLANVLTMMAAHYLLKQPKNTGWIKSDNTFKQI